ncbi:MAG: PQQ-binding-like beta-propeller repeat protein, partial [Acidobacteriia bacterium]|nr:PQQ-binding-like beta-propeller repeat protein [Terriglobia bacterium]
MATPLTRRDFNASLGSAVALGALPASCGRTSDGEWHEWGREPGGTRHSPLTQIHRGNVAELQPVWTHRCGEISDGSRNPTRTAYECTPLMADGYLYVTTPYNRVLALDPETGSERWAFDPGLDLAKRYNLWANRGVSLWRSASERRLLHGTLDGRLIALDPSTGRPCADFGDGGQVSVGARRTSPPPIGGAVGGGWFKHLRAPPTERGRGGGG